MKRTRGILLAWVGCLAFAASAQARGNDDLPDEKPTRQVAAPRLTLADRIPSVTQRKFTKDGRVELYPVLGYGLSDAFYRQVQPGLGFNYYLFETFALGLSAEYFVSSEKNVQIVGAGAQGPAAANKVVYGARLQALWMPFYGKVSWFAEAISHLDMYLGAHVGINSMKEGGAAPVVGFAIGQHHYITQRMALRLEIRDDFFKATRNTSRDDEKLLESQLSFLVGLSFYFPGLGPT